MTYNFHQSSIFSRDYFKNLGEITNHAFKLNTYTFHAHLYNLKGFILLATQEIKTQTLEQ